MPRRRSTQPPSLSSTPLAKLLADHVGVGGVAVGIEDADGQDQDLIVVAVYLVADAVTALLDKSQTSDAAAKKIGQLVLESMDATATDGDDGWPFNDLTEFAPDDGEGDEEEDEGEDDDR